MNTTRTGGGFDRFSGARGGVRSQRSRFEAEGPLRQRTQFDLSCKEVTITPLGEDEMGTLGSRKMRHGVWKGAARRRRTSNQGANSETG